MLDNFLGSRWQSDSRAQVVYCCVNLRSFKGPADPQGVREELGLASGTPLLIHVGRFCEPKNHCKLIDIFKCVHDARPGSHLLLVGEGPLMESARTQVNDLS